MALELTTASSDPLQVVDVAARDESLDRVLAHLHRIDVVASRFAAPKASRRPAPARTGVAGPGRRRPAEPPRHTLPAGRRHR
jgi:hypothetical protein